MNATERFKAKQRANAKPDPNATRRARLKRKHERRLANRGDKGRMVEFVIDPGGRRVDSQGRVHIRPRRAKWLRERP